jgi:hypothetical protein
VRQGSHRSHAARYGVAYLIRARLEERVHSRVAAALSPAHLPRRSGAKRTGAARTRDRRGTGLVTPRCHGRRIHVPHFHAPWLPWATAAVAHGLRWAALYLVAQRCHAAVHLIRSAADKPPSAINPQRVRIHLAPLGVRTSLPVGRRRRRHHRARLHVRALDDAIGAAVAARAVEPQRVVEDDELAA